MCKQIKSIHFAYVEANSCTISLIFGACWATRVMRKQQENILTASRKTILSHSSLNFKALGRANGSETWENSRRSLATGNCIAKLRAKDLLSRLLPKSEFPLLSVCPFSAQARTIYIQRQKYSSLLHHARN